MVLVCQFLSLILCSLPLWLGLPEWSVASWVGGCWGALLLAGLSATWASNRLAWSAYCLITSLLSHASLGTTTDFGDAANWLIVTALLASGWSIGVALLPWNEFHRTPGCEPGSGNAGQAPIQFSAWDIFCATALAALFCSTIPAVENRFDLLCQIGPALAGGILLSVVALQWGWRDHWSLSSFVCVLVCLPILTLMLVPWTSIKQDFAFLAAWLISGPLSVVAAQFIVVLIGCAVLRQPRSENTLCIK